MLDVINYLASHPEIEEFLFVIGKESSVALICDSLKTSKIKKGTICYASSEQKDAFEEDLKWFAMTEDENCQITLGAIQQEEIASFRKEHNNMAIVFDSIPSLTVLEKTFFIKPKYLIGTVDRNVLSPFSIWDLFRNVCEYIYIQSWQLNHREETLDWKKNSDTPIELSVIFPVYNVASYLEKCIQSIIQWQAEYVEYIFVNDGSTDNSADIIDHYAKKDCRIKLLNKSNGGCASARQYGMEHAKGRYVGFIDPDDFIDPLMFQKLFIRALSGSYEICYSGYKELYEKTGIIKNIEDLLGWPYCEGTTDRHMINQLIAYRRIAIWRGIYLKDLIERNGIHFYTDIRRFDDLPFKIETLAVANSVVCVPEYLYYYRMSRPGQDVSADDERLYVQFPIFKYLDAFLQKHGDKEQIEYLQIVKIQSHQWALEKIKKQFLKEYVRQAHNDILSNMSFIESQYIAKKGTDKRNQHFNFALCLGSVLMIRYLLSRKIKVNKKREKQLRKLAALAKTR